MGDYVVKPPDRVFDRVFLATIVDRIDRNYALFKKIFDDEDFMCRLLGAGASGRRVPHLAHFRHTTLT